MGSSRTKQKKKAEAPSLDEAALAQLTTNIDKSLLKSEREVPAKRKRSHKTEAGPGLKRRQTRLSDANPPREKHARENSQSTKAPSSTLLDEILALGGDEADYELVANIDSDNEDRPVDKPKTPDIPIDESFRSELARFASGLGFQDLPAEEDTDSESVEEQGEEAPEEEDEQEEDEEQDKEQDKVEVAAVKKNILPLPVETRQPKHSGKLVFEPRPDWHAVSVDELPSGFAGQGINQHSSAIANLKAYAESLLEQDTFAYSAMQSSRSAQKFMSTIMTSGTLSDKVSALTLSIQESPVHNRKALESLINLAAKKSRGQAIAALGALVDLVGNGTILPADRRLRPFNVQPALLGSLLEHGVMSWQQQQKLPGNLNRSHLMMWAYEEWLKSTYFRIIQLLEVWCSDEIEYSRSRALDFVFGLLKSKPEQEANLLRLLVNKLGDRERKIASRASYLILQLLNLHPGMKAVIINAIEQEVLLKPGQSIRTRYYAINTLNQTILSTKEPSVADSLLRIYFEAFLSLLKNGSLGGLDAINAEKKVEPGRKKGVRKHPYADRQPHPVVTDYEQETTQKLVSSLLTGVNRTIPFTTNDNSTLEKHLDTLFRITHSSNFNTSVQALMLIQQLATSKHLAVERFYRTMYESLLDPRLITSSKQALYLNLLFRSMKNDVDVRRVKAFVKRLVQILTLHQPSFACGILFLITEMESIFPDLHALLDVPEDNGDDGEEVFRDVTSDDYNTASQVPVAPSTQRALTYDGRKRDPEHSNAHRSCLWEIVPFLTHFHPSVGMFAANLVNRQKPLPKPDLASHTLMHFLDKFVYRNPKAGETKRGGSIMQPVLASGSTSHLVVSNRSNARQQPIVNSASFWNLKAEEVSAEDVFFHEYFARIGKPGEAARVKKASAADAGSDEEEAEDEIWEALVNSRPEVEGEDAEDGSDIDMEDYDDSGLDVDDEAGKVSDIGSDESEAGFEGIFGDSDGAEGSEPDEEDAEDDAEEEPSDERRKSRLNRKEMRGLPTFASADDYAEMLAAEEDGLDDQ
ncbi:CBF/Mak21 family-domain-containing protein [Lasiosphaeria hispida]|uniref:CBF/Mak21 family-domain-containing protein n=1 Tax=Lasiosphaeria hispida TaxID=260671 RepID=A0AAJ0HUA5_9PEZI|nr:CBF/Mak21 family-domain-containing protein [Lasiosphaeria hispida]